MQTPDKIYSNITDTTFDQIPAEHRELAKLRVLDVIGCALGAAKDQGNPELVEMTRQSGGKKESTILGYGIKVPAVQAALVNSVMARSFDFEALGPVVEGRSIPAHISGTTVNAALAVAEANKISGKEFLTALIVGDDIVCRVLAASGQGGLPPGWDHVGTSNAFGSTASAGRMMGLSPDQIRHAFGIATNQMSGSMQSIWDGSPVFKLLQGLSAKNGVFSAKLAKAGWTGPDDPLLGKHGFYDLFTKGCNNPDILTKDLGKVFYSDAHFKPYPCCAVSQSAIDCALAIREQGLNPDVIESIELLVTQGGLNSFLNQPINIKDHPHTSVLFNYRYHVASALLRGRLIPDHFTEKAIRDSQITAMVEKVNLSLLPDQTADLLTSALKVTLKNGQILEADKDFPLGDPLHYPLSQTQISTKFFENAAYTNMISRENAEKAHDWILRIETCEDMGDLAEILV